jgi:corrinoid protein of di/trimethylamine methyltransferase
MSEGREKELFERLKQGVINYDEEEVAATAKEVVEEGIDAVRAVFEGLVPGMEHVGELYEQQEYFVPELLMCADAMYAGLNILRPHMSKKDLGITGVVVMGVVQGDVHDIGKNIVKMMFDVAGFEVHDLGRDVPLEVFVEEQLRTDADLVCLSAMMTTTMVGMKDIIAQIKAKNPSARIMIGGAPVTEEIADKFGADGYAPDASNALKDAIKMLSSLKKIQEEAESA